MNISLLGIIAIAFAPIVTSRNGSEALRQDALYSLNMSDSYNGNSTNFDWNMLKSLIHPKAAVDVIFEAFEIGVNKLLKNRNTYIYLPALIGMISTFLIIMLIVFMKSIFKRFHSLSRLTEIKQTSKQLDDKALLIQNKNLDHNMDSVFV